MGTPEFMAPEIYDEQYDEKVDIYRCEGVGCVGVWGCGSCEMEWEQLDGGIHAVVLCYVSFLNLAVTACAF